MINCNVTILTETTLSARADYLPYPPDQI